MREKVEFYELLRPLRRPDFYAQKEAGCFTSENPELQNLSLFKNWTGQVKGQKPL
jgi:hypothetical protein